MIFAALQRHNFARLTDLHVTLQLTPTSHLTPPLSRMRDRVALFLLFVFGLLAMATAQMAQQPQGEQRETADRSSQQQQSQQQQQGQCGC